MSILIYFEKNKNKNRNNNKKNHAVAVQVQVQVYCWYVTLLYGWVCFRHAIGQFAVCNLLYGPKFLKKMLISEL